jgi:hypothetical protein
MSNHLFLQFTGLCGFVPKLPIDQANNQMRVLLVDDTMGGMMAVPADEVHVPVLVCPWDRVAQTAGLKKPDRKYFSTDGNKMALFFLKDQDLKISGAHADSLSIANYVIEHCPGVPPPPPEAVSFRWVAPIADIGPGAQDVKPACLANAGAGVDSSVAARVSLTQGTIGTLDFASESNRDVIRWEFKVDGGPAVTLQQALAETVQLDYPFPTGATTIDLEISPLRGTGGTQTIRLLPVAASTGKVVAAICNQPLLDLFSLVHNPGLRDADFHFKHFYDLSITPPPALNIPYPLDHCGSKSGPALANPQCPPALFNPNTGA